MLLPLFSIIAKVSSSFFSFFFFNDTATTEIYTLSLHDALPIPAIARVPPTVTLRLFVRTGGTSCSGADRKSTRLNSSHVRISYAVFCLKKKQTLLLTGLIRDGV